MRRALISAIIVLLAVNAYTLVIADNLIKNGSFEVPKVENTVDHYEHRLGTELTDWTSSIPTWRGTVQFDNQYDCVSEGVQAVQIEAGGEWISQVFDTEIGKSYILSYDLTAYSGYGPNYIPCDPYCTAILKVTVGTDSELELFKDEPTGYSIGYVRHTLIFTANSTEMILKFENPFPYGAWWNYPQIDNVVVNANPDIDIKPGSFPNSINPKSQGKIPVAILSSEGFNAPEAVDQSSLTFGHTGDETSLAFCNIGTEDVNGDGLGDLICHFYTQLTGLQCGDIKGILKGETLDEIPFRGEDSVNIVPCK